MSLYGKERGTVAMDSGSDGIYLPMQRTGRLLVEVALLLIVLTNLFCQELVSTVKEEIVF